MKRRYVHFAVNKWKVSFMFRMFMFVNKHQWKQVQQTSAQVLVNPASCLQGETKKRYIYLSYIYGAKHHSNHHSRFAHPRSQGMLHAIGFKSKVSIMTTSVHRFIQRFAKWLNMYRWRVHSVGWWWAFLFDFSFNEMTIQNEEILGWPLAGW